MGAGNRTAIGTLVERTTRFLILLAFPDAVGSAEAVREAIGTALARLPDGLRRTLTWDQGKELASHQQIATATGAGVFFCEAHSPWQRGSNENMNGLLRDYSSRRALTCPCTPSRTSRGSLPRSTSDRARRSAGNDPRTCSTQRSRPVDRGRGAARTPVRAIRLAAGSCSPPAGRKRRTGMIVLLDGRGLAASAHARRGGNVNGTVKVRLVRRGRDRAIAHGERAVRPPRHRIIARGNGTSGQLQAVCTRADGIDGDLTSVLDSESSRARRKVIALPPA